ncbi:hypothetical protein [Rhizobium leguminosarum]|nr:hypothetical protein [Rhizobium leguminosarum]TAY13993.1 hypothetical protein ELH96_20550 [Rhizobium leguminosarum]
MPDTETHDISPTVNEKTSEAAMHEAYRLISDQVEQLEKARDAIDLKLARAREARESVLRFLDDLPLPETAVLKALGRMTYASKQTKRFRKGSKTGEVVARSKKILQESGRPMDRAELLERIVSSGYTIATSDPSRFIGRTLWESEDFVHIPKQGYWLAGVAANARSTPSASDD